MSKARLVLRANSRSVLPTIDAVVARERPAEPLVCLRPAVIAAASRRFVAAFPGDVLYAVKCNPEPRVLRAVWAGGVRSEEHTSELQSRRDLVCRLLLEKKKL